MSASAPGSAHCGCGTGYAEIMMLGTLVSLLRLGSRCHNSSVTKGIIGWISLRRSI